MDPIIVDIPGVGEVEFPGSMNEQEIAAAAKRLHDTQSSTDTPSIPGGIGGAVGRSIAPAVRGAQTAAHVGGRVLGSSVGSRAVTAATGGAAFGPLGGLIGFGQGEAAKVVKGVGRAVERATEAPRHTMARLIRMGATPDDFPVDLMQRTARSPVNRVVGAIAKASPMLGAAGSAIDAVRAGKKAYDFFSTHDPIPASERLSQKEQIERTILLRELAKNGGPAPERPQTPPSAAPVDRVASAASKATSIGPDKLMEAARMLPMGITEPRKAQSFFEVGNKLLQRFGTKAAPTSQEIEALLRQVPNNLGALERGVLTQLKGRLRMLIKAEEGG